MCPSCPHPWLRFSTTLRQGTDEPSDTASASMSARSAMVGPGRSPSTRAMTPPGMLAALCAIPHSASFSPMTPHVRAVSNPSSG